MKRKVMRYLVLFFAFAVLLLVFAFMSPRNITGFVVLSDSNSSDFGSGTFVNSLYNGSAVVLDGTGNTGTFTSRVFDAGEMVNWNNISLSFDEPSLEFLFAVDASAAVYYSIDEAANWAQATSDYGGGGGSTRDMFSNDDYLFMVFSSSGSKQVWRSEDFGANWGIVNDTFTNTGLRIAKSDSNGHLFIVLASGDVWRSTDDGVSWEFRGDANGGASNDPKGIAIDDSDNIFIVDASGSVFESTNGGTSWSTQNDSYGGTSGTDGMTSDSSSLYILFNEEVYKSSNDGITWQIVSADFGTGQDGLYISSNSEDDLFIVDPSGDVFKSTNGGADWSLISDFNGGASNNNKGLTNILANTGVSYQFRNCSSSDCSDGSFVGSDGTENTYFTANDADVSKLGRYFQYKVFFESDKADEVTSYLSNVDVDYSSLAAEPVVTIVHPTNTQYSTNESLELNFSVESDYLDSCWYTIDSGVVNSSIAGCGNTTFDVPSSGSYTLDLYASETISGLVGNDSVDFSVALGAPEIEVLSPSNGSYTNNRGVSFTFNATTDYGIDTCRLFGDFGGSYGLNQSNSSVSSGELGSFFVNLSNGDGSYTWAVDCNSTESALSSMENLTLYLDTGQPNVTVYEPNGTYQNNTVPLNFTVVDPSPVINCDYVLNFTNGGSPVSVRVSTLCQNANTTAITVDAATDYDLVLESNDSAGNVGTDQTTFIVQQVIVPSSSGGGGGGGGGSFTLKRDASVSVADDIFYKVGSSNILPITIENTGAGFLNECRLQFSGEVESWFSSDFREGLGVGEVSMYDAMVVVPEDAEVGNYSILASIVCSELTRQGDVLFSVYQNDFDAIITDYERIGNDLRVFYNLFDFSGTGHSLRFSYSLVDLDGIVRFSDSGEVVLGVGERLESVLEFRLPKDSFGEFDLVFVMDDGVGQVTTTQRIFLPSGAGSLTGFASFGEGGAFSIASVVLLLVAIAVVVFFLVRRFRRKTKKIHYKKSRRHLLELDF